MPDLQLPVITVDVANAVFLVFMVVGGVLLFTSVVLGDLLGGVLDALHFSVDIGGVSLMPVLLGFVAMFGVGGLIGTELFRLGSGPATIVGVAFGAAGATTVQVMFRVIRRAQTPPPFSLRDLVGQTGRVSVTIPAGRYGSVLLSYEGQVHNLTATAETDIPAGSNVRVTAAIGSTLVVAPLGEAAGVAAVGGSQSGGGEGRDGGA